MTTSGACNGGGNGLVDYVCDATIKDGYGEAFLGARVVFIVSDEFGELAIREGTTSGSGEALLKATLDSATVVDRLECAVYDTRETLPIRRDTPKKVAVRRPGPGPESRRVRLAAKLAPSANEDIPVLGRKPGGVGHARLYLPADGSYRHAVVVPEPIDFAEQNPALSREQFEFWFRFEKLMLALHDTGYAVWLVEPFRTGQNIHEQAAEYAQGIQTAATYNGGPVGGKVIAAGYSLGGIVTRVATARWEADPAWRADLGLSPQLPVSLVLLGDAPLRGGMASVELQDFLWDHDQQGSFNLNSCAAQQMLQRSFPHKNWPAGDWNFRSFYQDGILVMFFDDRGVCDSAGNGFCLCEAGPAVFSINGDGFPHTTRVAALSVGTWSDPNKCYGGANDRNSARADLCPHDPGGDSEFVPSAGDVFLHMNAVGCIPLWDEDFHVDDAELQAGSRFPASFDGLQRVNEETALWEHILGALVFCPGAGSNVRFTQYFAPTFIPIRSALAADSPSTVPFAVGDFTSASYQASHDVLPPDVEDFVFEKLRQATGSPLGNLSPTPSVALPGDAQPGIALVFDSAPSHDADGSIEQVLWEFGDGAMAVGPSATHAFTSPGTYDATLTVVDDQGASASTSYALRVGDPGTGNTHQGANVAVTPRDVTTGTSPLTVTFPKVFESGTTVLETSGKGPALPPHQAAGQPPVYLNLVSTAKYGVTEAERVKVCVNYDRSRFRDAALLGLFQWDRGDWAEITISKDTQTETICGVMESLSTLAVFEPNRAPVAVATVQTPVQCSGRLQGQVVLDGSASGDPDGDRLTYVWSDALGNPIATTAVANLDLPLGRYGATLHVTDLFGAGSEASVLFDVVDTMPPAVAFAREVVDAVLVRPGATETPVDISGSVKATDVCDPNARIVSDLVPRLPLGVSDVLVLARDAAGNESKAHLKVWVVYDFGGFLPPLDNGGVYFVGETIPVTFQLRSADGGPVSTAVAWLGLFRSSGFRLTKVPVQDATFQFADDRYLNSLSTDWLASGSYVIRGVLDDGTAHDVAIWLQ